jgi:glycosyltransferase involved in cell wall biosynthesis
VPVYAGKFYLEKLTEAVAAVRQAWEDACYLIHLAELIFVDDGSSDGSCDVLKQLDTQDWIKVITLSRNYGQHPATVAGISYSSGDWVVTLDEDLQHDPKHILDMLKLCVEHDADIVYAKPKEWVHKLAFRGLSSRCAKALVSYMTNNPNTRHFNSFRLMRGTIARTAASISSH